MISLFLTYRLDARRDAPLVVPHACRAGFHELAGVSKVLLHQPGVVDDPLLPKGSEPSVAADIVVQVYFDELAALEAACEKGGALAGCLAGLESLLGPVQARSQQAMVVRAYPVAGGGGPAPDLACTYLVAYGSGGAPHDVWLDHYVRGHVPLMTRLPGVREVEIHTRLDWLSGLDMPRADAVQRNKVVFDNPEALQAALQSSVRAEMRADYLSLPDIGLRSTHGAMRTERLAPGR